MRKDDKATEKEKIKTVVRFTQKRGNFLAVLDAKSDHLIGWIGEHDQVIEDNIPDDQRLELLSAFDNFKTLINMKMHTSPLSRLMLRIPKEVRDSMLQAFAISEKNGFDFCPSQAVLRALIHETTTTLKKVGINPDLPQIQDPRTTKHNVGKKIFEYMLDNNLKGFKSVFDEIALKDFGKSNIELQYLYNYKYGKSKTPMWAYAAALETMLQLNIDVFKIDVPENLIFDFWYSAHKDILNKDAILNKFKNVFKPNTARIKNFEQYIEQRIFMIEKK